MKTLVALLPVLLIGCASQPEVPANDKRITVMNRDTMRQIAYECRLQKHRPLKVYVKRKQDKKFVTVNMVCV